MKFLTLTFGLFLTLGLIAQFNDGTTAEQPKDLYEKANSYFEKSSPTSVDDSLALYFFRKYIDNTTPDTTNALLLFNAMEKAAILEQMLGEQLNAIPLYKKALNIHTQFSLNDILAFKPYLYTGNAYYFLNNWDSAIAYYRKAETIVAAKESAEYQRLYNSLGALYFEGGNFSQSINYFSLALSSTNPKDENFKYISYVLKSNIAAALQQMHLLDSALAAYKSLIPGVLPREKNTLMMNIGNIYLEKSNPDSAAAFFDQVSDTYKFPQSALSMRVAKVKMLRNDLLGAKADLLKAISASDKKVKNAEIAEAYKALGDIEIQQKNYEQALQHYQSAIVQSVYSFNDSSITSNPEVAAYAFNNYGLFEILIAKANGLTLFKQNVAQINTIDLTIKTYESAFALLEHINKFSDNEQARLFVNAEASPAYEQAVTWLYNVYQTQPEMKYMQTLLQWTERSKAVTLFISKKENLLKTEAGIPDSLLLEEKRLRNSISSLRRQSVQAEAETLQQIESAIMQQEVQLSRLTSKFHEFPQYFERKYSTDTLTLKQIQQLLPDKKTAVLTYYGTDSLLLGFTITKNGINIAAINHPSSVFENVMQYTRSLQEQNSAASFREQERILYDQLFSPFSDQLSGIHQLVVVPHNQLRYLPFDALHNGEEYLLKRFAIIYQHSLSFLQQQKQNLPDFSNSFVMAPFVEKPALTNLSSLPASQEEVKHKQGIVLLNKDATKQAFIEHVERSSVIHLATHAVTDNDYPARSFIAFYPTQISDSSFKLFASDIPALSLHQNQLLFLSACETAAGKLHGGEGILSLSRAFAEAGSANMITSLWKAEDRATAFISQQFYHHLSKEKNYAVALQKAKQDLLNDLSYAQFHSPAYWSHLIYAGNVQPVNDSYFIQITVIVLAISIIYILNRYRKKKAVLKSLPND